MIDRRELAGHLQLFADLGVTGVSRDPSWRQRIEAPEPSSSSTPPSLVTPAATPAQSESSKLPAAPLGEHRAEAETAQPDAAAVGDQDAAAPAGDQGSDPLTALGDLRTDIGDCTRCALHALGRRQIVFGVGSPTAQLMFVGEAPGADEDVQGEPFVGRAGQLLTKIIEAIGLSRADVYIANVIKCRPPGNRNPEPAEIATCQPFLLRQIEIIRPKVIVALGTFAAHTLLGTDVPISKLRGRVHEFHGTALVPTFHPAFLLRSPDRKRDVWEDMKKVRALLTEAG